MGFPQNPTAMFGITDTQSTEVSDQRPAKVGNAAQMAREMERERRERRAVELKILEPGALYIVLYYREGLDNNFHWGLYHHINPAIGGRKFHIIGRGLKTLWMPDHVDGTGILDDTRLMGLMRLTHLGTSQQVMKAAGDTITLEDDMLEHISGLTCRVYVQRACERLKEGGLIGFPNWTDLQAELFAFGNTLNPEMGGDSAPPQPRPVVNSAIVR